MIKILLFICIFAIEYFAISSTEIKIIQSSWDKLNHFIAFFVLCILLNFSYLNLKINLKITILFLLAVQIELTQFFLPDRYFSLLDIFASCTGILIGILVLNINSYFSNN